MSNAPLAFLSLPSYKIEVLFTVSDYAHFIKKMRWFLCIGNHGAHRTGVRLVLLTAPSIDSRSHSFLTLRIWRRKFFPLTWSSLFYPPTVSNRNKYLTGICVSSVIFFSVFFWLYAPNDRRYWQLVVLVCPHFPLSSESCSCWLPHSYFYQYVLSRWALVMMLTWHTARSLCFQGVSEIFSASLLLFCSHFSWRIKFKTLAQLALIKVTDYLYDITRYTDTFSTRPNLFPLMSLELRLTC